MGIDSLLIPEEHTAVWKRVLFRRRRLDELGRLGAPTYVLYQLPGGF